MAKMLSYKLLGTALKSLSDACFKADEQQRNGEVITAIQWQLVRDTSKAKKQLLRIYTSELRHT